MKPISPDWRPAWSKTKDEQKFAFINNLVEEQLAPQYSDNADWLNFRNFLERCDEFAYSGHFYRYLNTFGLLTRQLGELKGKVIVETGVASTLSVFCLNPTNALLPKRTCDLPSMWAPTLPIS